MPAIVIKTFADVQAALNKFVTDNKITLGPPHGAFWQNGANPGDQYDKLVNGDAIPGFPILVKGSGKNSNIIKALSGIAPFDRATNPSHPFPDAGAPRPLLGSGDDRRDLCLDRCGGKSVARANKAIDPPTLILPSRQRPNVGRLRWRFASLPPSRALGLAHRPLTISPLRLIPPGRFFLHSIPHDYLPQLRRHTSTPPGTPVGQPRPELEEEELVGLFGVTRRFVQNRRLASRRVRRRARAVWAIDLAAVATTTDQRLSVAFRTHEQPGRRRGAVTGSADIPWTSAMIAGILTPHACPARCGARRRT